MSSICQVIPNTEGLPQLVIKASEAHQAPVHNLVSRECRTEDTHVTVGGQTIGGAEFTVIAGPCAVDDETGLMETAREVKRAGAAVLRGGAFKPRTSPYSFQGLGEDGLKLLSLARERTGLPVVTEAMDSSDVDLVGAHADVIQIGARNSQNFSLLKRVGRANKPVLLKRGLMTTLDEFLMSAEYILAAGNPNVILCERGIRTFEVATRHTLDLSAVPVLKERTHLPVIVDPSHAVGDHRYVCPLAKASLAVGADGIMVEVHSKPEAAKCDGQQALTPEVFGRLMDELRPMAGLVGRTIKAAA